jgi:hypothetical protein
MICYMPFVDIDDRLLDKLTSALGPLTLYGLGSGMVSDHLLAAAREGRLDLRSGHGVDPDHLARAMQDFKAWAELHGGQIADLAGLSRSMQGGPPLVDQENPTSIGNQIRQFGRQHSKEAADPVFQAALFLSMARQFDQQQAAVARDLGQVQAMERTMLARLAGGGQDLEEGIGAEPEAGVAAGTADPGAFMTGRRVQSWAEWVCRDTGTRSFTLYVTSSPAVLDYLLDRFEPVRGPLRIRLEVPDNGAGYGNREVIEALECLASAKDPATASADCFRPGGNGTSCADLAVYALAGIPPQDFPSRLLASRSETVPGPSSGQGFFNTLIGLVEK